MKIIPKELIKALRFQIKKKNAFKNLFITHNAFGILSPASHINNHSNISTEKIKYKTVEGAFL